MSIQEKFTDEVKMRANGQWASILSNLAKEDIRLFNGGNHPCPKCGDGEDRFSFPDWDGDGAIHCRVCATGVGDGIASLMWFQGKTNTKDFLNVRDEIAEHLGMTPPERSKKTKKKKKKSSGSKEDKPPEEIKLKKWIDEGAVDFFNTKAFSKESLLANGGQFARRLEGEKESVIALPILPAYGKDPVGWVMYERCGLLFNRSNGSPVKILNSRGAGKGWVGADALKKIKDAEIVWKVEGVSDMLTLWDRIPEDQRNRQVVLTNPFGAGEKPRAIHIEALKGKTVYIVHDVDDAGKAGALKWSTTICKATREVRVINLPVAPEFKGDKGFDLGDYFQHGGSFEYLEELANDATSIDASMFESEKQINDPQHLAVRYTESQTGKVGSYKSNIFKYEGNTWIEEDTEFFSAEVSDFIEDEFEKDYEKRLMNAEDGEIVKRRPINPHLIDSVVKMIKSVAIINPLNSYNSLIKLDPKGFKRRKVGMKKNWLCLENGILDLEKIAPKSAIKKGEITNDALMPHTDEWFSTTKLPFEFDADATERGRFEFYLETSLGDDPEKILVLQEFAGLLLFEDTSFHKFLFLEGQGSNGKNVFLAILTALLGPDNVSSVPLESFGARFGLTPTIGKKANIISEIGELDKVGEGALKNFVSGEQMMFDRKNKEPIHMRPTARLVIATNTRPRFVDKSQGLWRRMILVPFTRQITKEAQVQGMDDPQWWIDSGEMPAIFNWALQGAQRLRSNYAFTEPKSSKEALQQYQLEVNPIRSFLLDNYKEDPQGEVSTQDLYDNYKKFAENDGYRQAAKSTVGKEVKSTFPKSSKVRSGGRVGRYYAYAGISEIGMFDSNEEVGNQN